MPAGYWWPSIMDWWARTVLLALSGAAGWVDKVLMDMSLSDLQAASEEQRLVLEMGPLAAPGRLRRVAPFSVFVLCLLASLVFDTKADRADFAGLGIVSVLSVVFAALIPWKRLPRRSQAAFLFLPLFLVEGFMRADGGLDSHVLPAMLVPLFWMAVYESRRCLFVGLAVATALVGVDLAGHPPLDDAMRSLVLLAVAFSLFPSIRRLVGTNRAALVAITTAAQHDSLTGLANRRGVTAWLDGSRHFHSDGLGLIFADLDRFKQIYDRFGHDAGDDLLVAVGQRISGVIRSGDNSGARRWRRVHCCQQLLPLSRYRSRRSHQPCDCRLATSGARSDGHHVSQRRGEPYEPSTR